MPVISVICSKGGSGKSTSATLLAIEFARTNDVVLIDADPNQGVVRWSQRAAIPGRLKVRGEVDETNIGDAIVEASRNVPIVIVDCEGRGGVTTTFAVGHSDLVIIPAQGSMLDAEEVVKSLKMVENVGSMKQRRIACAVLFTRTSPSLNPRTLRAIRDELVEGGVRVFDARLDDREAFRAIFSFGGTLDDLTAQNVSNIAKARDNAAVFAQEVKQMIAEGMEG